MDSLIELKLISSIIEFHISKYKNNRQDGLTSELKVRLYCQTHKMDLKSTGYFPYDNWL